MRITLDMLQSKNCSTDNRPGVWKMEILQCTPSNIIIAVQFISIKTVAFNLCVFVFLSIKFCHKVLNNMRCLLFL